MAVSADMNKDEDEGDGCHDETNDHQGSMYLYQSYTVNNCPALITNHLSTHH